MTPEERAARLRSVWCFDDTTHDADLLAADIAAAICDAVAAERERCAKIVESLATDQPGAGVTYWGEGFAKLIREGK